MNVFNTKNNNLDSLPLANLYKTYKESEDKETVLKDFSAFLDLRKKPWFLPQLLAHFPNKFPAKKVGDKYNLATTLGSMQDADRALYFIAQDPARTNYIASMQKNPEYSALVPLILAGYKKYSNINYLDWDKDSLKLGIPESLMQCLEVNLKGFIQKLNEYRTYTTDIKEEILSYRDAAYLETLGSMRSKLNVTTSYNLSATKTPFADTPRLFKYIELQGWLAHPSLRNKYMILDVRQLDSIPEPLVNTETLTRIEDHPFLK